ncbi:MAG: Ni/Fe-hydrogenase cytochrome b subunit [Deltaproteobacteria bacterium]|nr:Ni/Fe-hydrogenase cytochrome b subunit [Deltaproteobacteria bacterium]
MNTQNPAAKNSLLTPFNVTVGIIFLLGALITFLRFTKGLAGVTNLSDNNPWGVWISFDLMCGVALAAGGYTTSAACYVFGLKRYHSAVRPAILTAFLGYALVVFALHYDVGRPWRLPYPIFVQSGTTSVLFEVGLCVFLYLITLFVEWTPAALEWLGFRKYRNIIVKGTLALTIFGVVLSTMHQSSLGALYLIAPSKLHPLWYSSYIPLFFFISSIAAGLSMVIFEGTLSHHFLHHKMDRTYQSEHNEVVLGFSKGAAMVLACYFLLKLVGVALDNKWHYLLTGYGAWFLVELLGFVALPCFLYAITVREKNLKLAKYASILTVLGIVLNRFNVSWFAFNWQLPAADRYFPSWMEIAISIYIVTIGVLFFRFISTKMPIFYEHPEYREHAPHEGEEEEGPEFTEHKLHKHPQTFGH